MKKLILACVAPLAVTATPILAQDEDGSESEAEAAALAQMQEMFAAEPLTAEQAARLPLARELVGMILPDGAMGEIMNTLFDGFLDPMMALAEQAGPDLVDQIGEQAIGLELDESQTAEVASLIDPNWKERRDRELVLMQQFMGEIMTAMEPAMRKGMSEAYAANFTGKELEDISAFFATESGGTYARKSFALSSDPRIIGAAMEQMPTMMEQFKTIDEKMRAAMSDLGEPRSFEALNASERARLSELTGFSEEELRSGMEEAAAQKATDSPFG